MTPEQETLLSLIKIVVRGTHDVFLKKTGRVWQKEQASLASSHSLALSSVQDVCWAKVMEEATKQGVQGLCFDALELLPAEQRPDKAMLLGWLGQVVCMERQYGRHKKATDQLSCFYRQYGIKMLLLKGFGLSLCWPKPEHRPAGDMDIYIGSCWQEADRLVGERLGIKVDDGHEHHTCFTFQGVSVENHYDFVNTKVNESSRELETLFKRLATFDKPLKMEKGEIFLPSPTLNAIFLIRHLGQHFAGAEATLRQLLDWGFFMQHEHEKVDWELVGSTLKKVGIYRFFQQINAICVDYLGFSESSFPQIEREAALERRIMEDILSPEFGEEKPKGNTLQVICFKIRRFFANRWKRELVYREGIWSQLWHGSIVHIRRFRTIRD